MKLVRAKFYVSSVGPGSITSDGETTEGKTIVLSPVTSGSKENEEFYKMTPGGSIQLSTINDEAAAQFIPGKEYYVEFIAAEQTEAAQAETEVSAETTEGN